MLLGNLKNCIKGWFVGDFPNAVFQDKQVEIALKRYPAGFREDCHYHSECTEVTAIITGSVSMNGVIHHGDDVIVIEPFEHTDFVCLTDVVTVVYKNKSSISDKFPGKYVHMKTVNDVAEFLDPHTFFSFLSEESDKVIVYVSHMDASVLGVINQVPDKVENKHVLFHFESCLDNRHSPKANESDPDRFKTVSPEDDFVAEQIPLYGLTESLSDLQTDNQEIDLEGDKVLAKWSLGDGEYTSVSVYVSPFDNE